MPAAVSTQTAGCLTLGRLTADAAGGLVDAVVVGHADLQGRLVGKRGAVIDGERGFEHG